MDKTNLLAIGEVARRSGVAPSALRYYETLGLITSTRTSADRRRYPRAVLRRIAVIRAGQRVGLSLQEIVEAFRGLDPHRAPNKAEWTRISKAWRPALEQRIADLERVRDDLTGCIGCGCLSLQTCSLYNHQDTLGAHGSGSRRLFPDDGFVDDPPHSDPLVPQ